jgi:beta-alanine degradation protein BauB
MSSTMTYGNEVREEWPDWVQAEYDRDNGNGCVGTKLVSETDRVRIWEIRLQPGERIGFHRHVLDYFWTAILPGRARSHMEGGRTMERDYYAGETQHESYRAGESKVHDLENTGTSELIFTTVEFKDSANEPISVPDSVRLAA